MTLWYAETVSMAGRWCPQLTPQQPQTVSKGGHLREQHINGVGRRIRAIQQIKAGDEAKPLSDLAAIYSVAHNEGGGATVQTTQDVTTAGAA